MIELFKSLIKISLGAFRRAKIWAYSVAALTVPPVLVIGLRARRLSYRKLPLGSSHNAVNGSCLDL